MDIVSDKGEGVEGLGQGADEKSGQEERVSARRNEECSQGMIKEEQHQ